MPFRRSIKGTQPKQVILSARVDGSAVTTSSAYTGLLDHDFDMKVAKGTGGASNEVTVTYDKAFKRIPRVIVSARQNNLAVEVKAGTEAVGSVVIETFQRADGTTGVDDGDFTILVIGSDSGNRYNQRP